VLIRVTDQGPGVPELDLPQIFDPFFRGEPSRSRDTGGVGLGLAIVKTCVEACQGTVTARNRQPSGLEVELVLNAATDEESQHSTPV
jgi:two-component system sensor histidine kinase CpxA